LAQAGVAIQADAMQQAYDLVTGQGFEADAEGQLRNADMSKSMWSEAYNRYMSSTDFTKKQDDAKAQLAAAQSALLKFDAEVKALGLARDVA
jgi:hypothetical protein